MSSMVEVVPDRRVVARLAAHMRSTPNPSRYVVERLRVQINMTVPGDDDLRELVVDLLAALDEVESGGAR